MLGFQFTYTWEGMPNVVPKVCRQEGLGKNNKGCTRMIMGKDFGKDSLVSILELLSKMAPWAHG